MPLAAWYAYHYAKTGFLFGNPEFLRYNAEATLTPLRILAAFGHRILHLTAHMNLFVPVLMACAAMLLAPAARRRGARARVARHDWCCCGFFRFSWSMRLLFSVLGGALLTRYLLPMYPLVLLAGRVHILSPRAVLVRACCCLRRRVFCGLFINPPYGFAPEDNLAYAHVIRMHQAGIAELHKRYPGATVLTAWPMSDELTRPELGYVKQPWDVVRDRRLFAAAD